MVDVETIQFRGQRCDHVVSIDFVGREDDVWDSKTIGCPDCGLTGTFVRMNTDTESESETMILHGEDSDMNPDSNPSQSEDSDRGADDSTADSSDPEVAESSAQNDSTDDDSEQEAHSEIPQSEAEINKQLVSEVEDARVLLEDCSYRELQSIASEYDDVKGNSKQEALVEQMMGKADVFDHIEVLNESEDDNEGDEE